MCGHQPDPEAEVSVPQSLVPLPDVELLAFPPGGCVGVEGALDGCGAAEGALDGCGAAEGALDGCGAAEGALDGCGVEDGAGVEDELLGATDGLGAPNPGFAAAPVLAGAGASGATALLLAEAGEEASLLLDGTVGELEDWLGPAGVDGLDHDDEGGVALS
jgi:hypothetical protein